MTEDTRRPLPRYVWEVYAARRVSAHDRTGLARLARYVTRPSLAQNRLKLLPNGNVLLELKRVWSDGTRAVQFEPLDFLAKLAALVFPPRTHRIRYQGASRAPVEALGSSWRRNPRRKNRPLLSADTTSMAPAAMRMPR